MLAVRIQAIHLKPDHASSQAGIAGALTSSQLWR
jgi:hypothetical protein